MASARRYSAHLRLFLMQTYRYSVLESKHAAKGDLDLEREKLGIAMVVNDTDPVTSLTCKSW